MSDVGLTHIALSVTDVDASISFYERFAQMKVVHRRLDASTQVDVAWLNDQIRPFVIVLIKQATVNGSLLPESHLGVSCRTREEVKRLCDLARTEGVLIIGPNDSCPPVGYWAYIRDPDGHTLEISYGQEINSVLNSVQMSPSPVTRKSSEPSL